jgi:23S rRNA (cytosine1962-C5)-methyltransferase
MNRKEKSIKRIILKKNGERRVWNGHPWVFDNEVERVLERHGASVEETTLVAGECADVETYNRHYIGRAFVNPNSKIVARIYSSSKDGADSGFFKHRLREAIARRRAAGIDVAATSCRLLFAEADGVPGLIVDRYVGWDATSLAPADNTTPDAAPWLAGGTPPISILAVQFLARYCDEHRETIADALCDIVRDDIGAPPTAIVEKVSTAIREKEGIPCHSPLQRGSAPTNGLVILENNHPFIVDVMGGQKTGCYLDQRDNHALAAKWAAGRSRVLDAFTYAGGFAVNAAAGGAQAVVAVDESAAALRLCMRNAALSGVEDRISTVQSDVLPFLTRAEREKERFDMIILDPPAFAPNHSALPRALAGYKEINLKAFRMINPGGVLITCSCSCAVSDSAFARVVADAARDAGRRVWQADFRRQPPDHPILLGYDESAYLKAGVYVVA